MGTTVFAPSAPNTPNAISRGADFHVSYNDRDYDHYGSDTTALVIRQMSRFYILNGDHRAAYGPLIGQGEEACLEYFREHAAEINHRSDRLRPDGTPDL